LVCIFFRSLLLSSFFYHLLSSISRLPYFPDSFEETTQDLESDKTRLEVEVEEARKTILRENEAREAAEIARTRIQRELAELREKYDEEVIIRTNLERYLLFPMLSSSNTPSNKKTMTILHERGVQAPR
jgi:hypothetical protein